MHGIIVQMMKLFTFITWLLKVMSAIPYLFMLMRLPTLKSRMPLIGARRMLEIAS